MTTLALPDTPALNLPDLPARPAFADPAKPTATEWDILLRWLDLATRHAEAPALAAWRQGDIAARTEWASAQEAIAAVQRDLQALLAQETPPDALAAAVSALAQAIAAGAGAGSGAPGAPAAPSARSELLQAALAIYLKARETDPSPSPFQAVGEAKGLLAAVTAG